VIRTLPEEIVNEMAQRRHRFHYYLWHRVRNSWSRLNERERHAIGAINPAWIPPRPALDEMRRPIRDNNSGEDFLYMHRKLLASVNDILARINNPKHPCVQGWRRVPQPEDTTYPVPDFPDSGLKEIKSVKYFVEFIARWEKRYKDPDYLRSVTLGQLGSDIEFTIRNHMQMRWAAPSPVGYRPTTVITERIDARWDAPVYNYLGDTYSSHVNPIFWKVHGWVDDRIEDWKRVRAIAGEIPWIGTWVASEKLGTTEMRDELPKIDRIISTSSGSEEDGFFRPSNHRRRNSHSY
jgi:hypothetical protein